MKPVIVIPVKNRLDLTWPLVEELVEQGGYDDLLVYDNGSDDGTWEFLLSLRKSLRPVKAKALTLHEMWNDGIDRAKGRHVVFLNNDIALDGRPDWVGRLCAPLGEWTALCPNYDKRLCFDKADIVPLAGIAAGRMDGSGGLAGFAFAVDGKWLKTYRFPEKLKWWYGDNDLVMTLGRDGRKYGMAHAVEVTHLDGGSQTAKSYDLEQQKRRDRDAFEAKWDVVV